MIKQGRQFDEALKKIACAHYFKILCIDITADEYEALMVGDGEWDRKLEEKPTQKISEWFEWFANGPLCHENDRERFRNFTSLSSLRTAFERAGYEKIGIVYRRKFNVADASYSTVSMELLPFETEDGHIAAYLFVRNITEEIRKYNASLEEDVRVQNHIPGKRTVLIVEDDELNREILTVILSDDYEVLQAENGAVGLEILQKNMLDISLVVLDVQMPVMNGYEFLDCIRCDPFLSKIPVIVATGSNDAKEEQTCLGKGASDFVEKPYNPDIIRSRIANIIRLKESAATMSMLQTDERTGLYTLQAFYYYARMVIDRSPEKTFSLTIFDIDHFKQINDNYGEEAGNKLLLEIADSIKEYTAASDINARFGAARFLLLREQAKADDGQAWIRDLFDSLQTASSVKGISFKAGIYDNVDRSLSISAICDRAIMALASTGSSFQNEYAVYDEAHAAREHRLAVMEADMRDAYDEGQFAAYYQPKHDVKTGKLVGAEALIRWIHPQLGFLPPGEFIPLFERNGFISYADFYILKRTCENMRKWKEMGLNMVPVSVNASKRDFDYDDFYDRISKTLADNEVDPSLIHIEVTETLFSEKMDEICRVLNQCREAGYKVELDDFGTGYSSLTTLATLPLDIMKLDMTFMRNYRDEKSLKILTVSLELAKNLGLKTVSEGVETEDQVQLLKEQGCDMIQGYYFSKPIPEDAFEEYLKKYSE